MRATILFLLAAVPVFAAASCGVPIRGGGYFEEDLDVSRYSTFAWDEERDTEIGDPRLEDNPFFEERLHQAVERELSRRGMRHDESSPALLVHHHLSVEDHVMVSEAVDESGYTTEEVYQYEEGTILVHLMDAETEENIWLGWAQSNIEPALGRPERMREWVDDLVARMFEEWPVPLESGG